MISSTPKSQPAVKFTVTVVDPCVQPVETNCIDPVAMLCVFVCPASSESVSVPAVSVKTRMLFNSMGAGEKVKVRLVPAPEAK